MNYDFLKSSKTNEISAFSILNIPFERVMSFPLSYMEISDEAKLILLDRNPKVKGVQRLSVKTIGDVVELGFNKLKNFVYEETKSDSKTDKIMYEIELALAKFSLKLKGSYFTVFDIKIEDLNLDSKIKDFLKAQGVNNVAELYFEGKEIFKRCKKSDRLTFYIVPIKNALMEFGTAVEETYKNFEKEIAEEVMRKIHTPSYNNNFFPDLISANQKFNDSIESVKKFVSESLEKNDAKYEVYDSTQNVKTYDYGIIFSKIISLFGTIEQFSKTCGVVSKSTLSRLKNGLPVSEQSINFICEALDLKESEILTSDKKTAEVSVHSISKDCNYFPLFRKLKNVGLKKKDLIEVAGVSRTTISRISNGKTISPEELQKIANYFNCSVDEIVIVNRQKVYKARKDKENLSGLNLGVTALNHSGDGENSLDERESFVWLDESNSRVFPFSPEKNDEKSNFHYGNDFAFPENLPFPYFESNQNERGLNHAYLKVSGNHVRFYKNKNGYVLDYEKKCRRHHENILGDESIDGPEM